VPDDKKPLGQQYYEEVEALKEGGMSNAEAVRQVAEKHGKKENAIRGGMHQYKRAHLDSGSDGASPRRRGGRAATTTVDDYLANARRALEQALALIDREVDEAKAALDAAQARYDEAVASVKDKKADIEQKALT
jgi:predicted  nucleic acid-binding Zn-ribbon protein